VTGASSGIGLEFAKQLAAARISVVLVARRKDRLEALSSEISQQYSVQTKVIVADLSTPVGIDAVVADTCDMDVGLLVNNAGIAQHGSFFHDKVDMHLKLLFVNVSAVTALAHAFGRRFADKGQGGILFLSSVSSVGWAWVATYSASKAFVTNLALILRTELKSKGVTIMALEPGLVASEKSDTTGKTIDFKQMGSSIQTAEKCVSVALRSFANGCARKTPGLLNSLRASYQYERALPSHIG